MKVLAIFLTATQIMCTFPDSTAYLALTYICCVLRVLVSNATGQLIIQLLLSWNLWATTSATRELEPSLVNLTAFWNSKNWTSTSVPRRSRHSSHRSRISTSLRSANRHRLIVPRCRLNTYGRPRAFPVTGPTVWNSPQPDELRDPACDVDSFKQFFKTILFSFY